MKYLWIFLLLPLFNLAHGQDDEWENKIPRTDLDQVFDSSRGNPLTEVQLDPGLYQAQMREDGDTIFYVIVQRFINDPQKRLVLMVPQNVLTGRRVGHGWIFQSRQVREGRALMLSPLSLDPRTGNIVVDSENERTAPVVLISKKSGRHQKNPYLLEGRNGGIDGKVMELSKVKYQYLRPVLRRRPSRDMFVGLCPNQSKLAVTSNLVSIHDDDEIDLSFQILQINGSYGELAGLAKSRFDSMSEADVTYENVERFASFYTLKELFGSWSDDNDERFLMATPAGKKGLYKIEVYARAKDEKNIIERFFDWLTNSDDD